MRGTHVLLSVFFIALALALCGCGGSNPQTTTPLPPKFTSTPATGAQEGVTYSYSISLLIRAAGL